MCLQIFCSECGIHHQSVWSDRLISHALNHRIKILKQKKPKIEKIECIDISFASQTRGYYSLFEPIAENGLLGIRGIPNMGNTCFASVIIQNLIHNKYLRNYFLSGIHSHGRRHANYYFSKQKKNVIGFHGKSVENDSEV